MNIKLKKIKYSLELSEETNMFHAVIYVNNQMVGYAKNDGHGGCTEYNTYYSATPEQKQLFRDAENYCKTLPPIKWNEIEIPMNMENYIDNEISNYINKKEKQKQDRKFIRDMNKGIVFGNKKSYQVVYWVNYDLEMLLKHPSGKNMISNKIKEIQKQGHTILNTNLPEDIFKEVETKVVQIRIDK
ncbi:MAG: hypothetical protein ACOCVF_00965 [bacterium]